ncbi:MAG: hypothetical protein QM773_02755 [Hyphomonadaceae bacterium]
MDTMLILWLVGGAVAVMAMMLVVVGLARRLDRDATAEKASLGKIMDIASKMKGAGGIAAAAGPAIALLAHAHTDSKSENEDKPVDPKTKQMRAFLTGLAITGGILMVIVGIITGDN